MRWILGLWCVFLLVGVSFAEGNVRFVVKDARTRLPLAGAKVILTEGEAAESNVWTDRTGVAVARGLAPGIYPFQVRAICEGVIYFLKRGKVTVHDGREATVCFTILPDPRERYEWNRVGIWKTSIWMTVDHLVHYLMIHEYPEPPLPKTGSLCFQVRDAVTGKPLSCVAILLKGPEITEPVGEEDTDEEGNATRVTPPGTYHYAVVAFMDGVFYERQRGTVTVRAGQATWVTLSLYKGI
jgi:hypothetical protein